MFQPTVTQHHDAWTQTVWDDAPSRSSCIEKMHEALCDLMQNATFFGEGTVVIFLAKRFELSFKTWLASYLDKSYLQWFHLFNKPWVIHWLSAGMLERCCVVHRWAWHFCAAKLIESYWAGKDCANRKPAWLKFTTILESCFSADVSTEFLITRN